MASILDTLFGVSLSTDKKDRKQKPKPMASKKLSLFLPPWAMEHEDSTQFADSESSHQLQPTSITRTNNAAAIPGPKFSPTLRDVKTWDCTVPTGKGYELVCAFMKLLRSCFLLLQCDNLALASWRTKIPIACLFGLMPSLWALSFRPYSYTGGRLYCWRPFMPLQSSTETELTKSIIVRWVDSKAQKAQISRNRLEPVAINQSKSFKSLNHQK